MKKLFLSAITLLLMLPIVVSAKELVKVYIFEAGGCPYCEAQEKYLKGLDSYNKKFKIVKKEAYVDHVDWEQGKDFNLSKTVAEAFQEAGFKDAEYRATPFVVISDKYAAAAFSEDLEDIINDAYEEGDKDIVGCYEKGNTNCLDYLTTSNKTEKVNNIPVIITIIISTILIIGTYIVKSTMDTKKIIDSKRPSRKKKVEVNEKNN